MNIMRASMTAVCMAMVSASAVAESPEEVSRQIDVLFNQSWNAEGLKPSQLADDATFLRRVTLDLTGVLPSVGEVRAFLADTRPDKRMPLIEELLSRPRHASHLANTWREVLLPRSVPEVTGVALETWLQEKFRDNEPYDEVVREILLAQGGVTESPPVIYYAALNSKPEQLAASVSSVFLGVQIRCAECHDHPFTHWRQEDFWSQAAFFARIQGPSAQGGASGVQEAASGDVRHPKTKAVVAPRFLDGTPVSTTAGDPRRTILARWITGPENGYFARATVNRVWHLMFGRGLVKPVDDMGSHNPPEHPEVLELLAKDFVASGFNLRRIIQVIAGTKLYQRMSTPRLAGEDDPLATYVSMPVRSLSAQQTYDCLLQASRRREPLNSDTERLLRERIAFLAQVEAPTRQATEFQGGIPQALTLLNGDLVDQLTDPQASDFVAALVDSPFLTDEQQVETLFLAALSRMPREAERTRFLEWIANGAKSGDKGQALSDVLWALLNSSEFVLIQ